MEDDHHIRRSTGGGDLITSVPLTAAPGAASSALDAGLAVSVQAVRAISAALADFAAAGCTVTDGLLACQVTIPQGWSDGGPQGRYRDYWQSYSFGELSATAQTRKALLEARLAEMSMLTLSVDARNRPAWDLYRSLDFEPYDRREVYLSIWKA